MRLKILFLFSILFGLLWSTSCRKDFDYAPSAGNLSFSKDTVYLDTVFSTIGSSTYTLKVYNDTRDDVLIPNISLKNGPESFYRLNVDGVAGKSFENVPLYAQDSLFILIETTIERSDNYSGDLLYTDAIVFDREPFEQAVALVTLAKDAIFLYPKNNTMSIVDLALSPTGETGNETTVTGFELLDTELDFTNEEPYVIYGYAMVPNGKELRIAAGARVFFHKNSGILVQDGATIKVNGTLSEDKDLMEGEVIFEGDRLEPEFSEMPGQWGALWIVGGSTDNYVEYLTLKNATVGIVVAGATDTSVNSLTLKNSQVYNNSRNNIWANHATLLAENLVLGGAGASSLLCENGGSYTFTHCTIANYWNKGFRSRAALEISNSSNNGDQNGFDLTADFKNCIITGNSQTELSLMATEGNTFNFSFQNCLIKYNADRAGNAARDRYDFTDTDYYQAIILNGSPDFFLPSKNDFRISLDSEGINNGDLNTAATVPFDILGNQRTLAPDLGAYQAKSRPE